MFSEDIERDQWHNPTSEYVLSWFNFMFIQLSVIKIKNITRSINFYHNGMTARLSVEVHVM